MQHNENCKTPSCENEAKCLGLCSACYSYFYYWHKKSPKAVIKRQHQIQLYTTRMDMLGSPVPIRHVKITAKSRLDVIPGTTRFKLKKKKAG